MKPILIFALVFLFNKGISNAQVTLDADGVGNTYELIDSKFAPGYTAVENPECVHPSFGRHVAEVFDATLNKYVFEFYSHVAEDNDRCINLDRERVEIKTYDQSPDNLKGVIGETITYKWKFKLPTGFQPSTSFTHIHQIKAVGGNDDPPIFTLTPRKKSVNKLQLIHNNTTTVAEVDLSLFLNVWVEATEVLKVGANGTYSLVIKRVSDNVPLLSYNSNDILTIRPDNTFIRPKWGIYRSLNVPTDLRDEAIRFAGFSIAEGLIIPVELQAFEAKAMQKAVLLTWTTASERNNAVFNIEHAVDGKDFETIGQVKGNGTTLVSHTYSFEHTPPSVSTHYYRLKQQDLNGQVTYSPIRSVIFNKTESVIIKSTLIHDVLDIATLGHSVPPSVKIAVFNTMGQQVLTTKVQGEQRINVSSLPRGLYIIRTETGSLGRFVKE